MKIGPIKQGVQAIVLIHQAKFLLNQKFLLVQDRDDRGTNTGIRKYGLPGGGIEEFDRTSKRAIARELFEETALDQKISFRSLQKVGCFKKIRPNGLKNDNHLFLLKLDFVPELRTNDPAEVSKTHILELRQIIYLYQKGWVHEGSIRLIFHYLNGNKFGLLNDPVKFNQFCF